MALGQVLEYVPAVSVLPIPGSPCSSMLSPFPPAEPLNPAALSICDEIMVSRMSLYSSSRARRFKAFSWKDTSLSCETLTNSKLRLDCAGVGATYTLTPHFVPKTEATHMLRTKHQCEIIHLGIGSDQIVSFKLKDDNMRRTI